MTRPSLRGSNEEAADSGLTLIELAVYASLLSVISIVIAGILMSNMRVSQQVGSSAQAASAGQLVAASITDGVRNADWVSTPTAGATQFFTAHTANKASSLTWRCQGWYFDSRNGGSLYTKMSSTKVIAPVGSVQGWTKIATGVSPVAGTVAFSGAGAGINVSLTIGTDTTAPMLVRTSVNLRQTAPAVTACQ